MNNCRILSLSGLVAWFLCVTVSFAQAATMRYVSQSEPLPIASLDLYVVGELNGTDEEVRDILSLYADQVYSAEELEERTSVLRHYFDLGGITVQMQATEQGWQLAYVLKPRPRIARVEIFGADGLRTRRIRRKIHDHVWNSETEQDLRNYIATKMKEDDIQEYNLAISTVDMGAGEISLSLVLDQYQHRTIQRVYGPQLFQDELIGKSYQADELAALMQEILQQRREDGYWAADAKWAASMAGTTVTLAIDARDWDTAFRARFDGASVFEYRELLEALTPDLSIPLREIQTGDLEAALMQKYHAYGYADARVAVDWQAATTTETEEDAAVLLRVLVSEGEVRRIRELVFDDFSETEEKELRALIALTDSRWIHVTSDQTVRLSPDAAEESRTIIGNYLRDRGYLASENAEFRVSLDGFRYTIHVAVERGPLYYFGAIEGTGRLPGIVPEPQWQGRPYNRAMVQDWKSTLDANLAEHGYIQRNLRLEETIDDDARIVRYRVAGQAGRPYRIRAIHVKGIPADEQDTMMRLMPMSPGDPARQSDLVETRRRMYLLNIFRTVEASWFQPDPYTGDVDVLIQVRSKDAGEIVMGLGLNTAADEGVSGTFLAEHRNLLGNLRKFQLRGDVQYRYTTILENFDLRNPSKASLQFTYFERWIFGTELQMRVSAGIERDARESDHEFVQYQGLYGFDTGELDTQFHYAYYAISRLDKFLIYNPVLNPMQKERVAKLKYQYSFSTLDNRFDPREGFLASGKYGFAHEYLGSMFDFTTLEADMVLLQPLFRRMSMYISGSAGLFFPIQNAGYYPRTEKFRLGGAQSIRGYMTDSIGVLSSAGGIADAYVNIGGLRSFSYQLELRVPVVLDLELVVFQDGGIVLASETDASVSGSGASVGGGFLYHTPVGPIRLDLGAKLLENRIDTSPINLHFYIGTSI